MKSEHLLPSDFRKRPMTERLQLLLELYRDSLHTADKDHASDHIAADLHSEDTLGVEANTMIESCIGTMPIPLGIVSPLYVDGCAYTLPLATEESSVVAAANYASRIFKSAALNDKVVHTSVTLPLQVVQIALGHVDKEGEERLNNAMAEINTMLMLHLESMHRRGGGLRKIEYRRLPYEFFVIYITVDVQDAMGANVVNTAAEFITPKILELTQAPLIGAIVSNYSEERTVRAEIELDVNKIPSKTKDSEMVARNIEYLCKWAQVDIYRAATHNKGIMNGVVGLALATGNDTRAIESASHTLAVSIGDGSHISNSQSSFNAPYKPLSNWEFIEHSKLLRGRINLPALFATKGGATSSRVASWCISLLSMNLEKNLGAHILNRVAAALGLAQNFAALLAISSEGIQRGHMQLHKRKQEHDT